MDPENFPPFTEALVQRLEAIYPDKAPGPDDPLDVIRFKSGQVSVVRYLRRMFEAQNNPSTE